MTDDLVTQKFCIFLLHAESVILFILVPVLQFDNQIDLLFVLDTLYSIQ